MTVLSRGNRRRRPSVTPVRLFMIAALLCVVTSGAGLAVEGSGAPTGSWSPIGAGGLLVPSTIAHSSVAPPALSPRAILPSATNPTWYNITADLPNLPSPRSNASVVWDAGDGYFLLFGGERAGSVLGDTWKFQNGNWSQVSSSVNPPPRYGAGIAYDAADGYVVLFGGGNATGTINGTWEFAGGQWKSLAQSTPPRSRLFPCMAYDPVLVSVIMFGGLLPSNQSAGTWQFLKGQWTQANPGGAGEPADRVAGTMAYDNATKSLLMFGGWDPETPFVIDLSDTWQYIANNSSYPSWGTWKEDNTTVHPNGRYGTASTFDTTDNAVVLFDGINGTIGRLDSDTWLWNNGNWSNVTSVVGHAPTPRAGAAMAPDILPGTASHNASFAPLTLGGWSFVTGATIDLWYFGKLPLSVLPPQANPRAVDTGVETILSVGAFGGTGGYGYLWENLPSPCITSNSSQVSCLLSTPGLYSTSVRVTDSSGAAATSSVATWTVSADPVVTQFTALPSPIVQGATLTITVRVSGGSGSLTYAYGGLPPGCVSTNASTIACHPQSVGSFTLTVQVNDSDGLVANKTTQVTVTPSTGTNPAIWEYVVELLVVVIVAVVAILIIRRKFGKRPPSSDAPRGPADTGSAAFSSVGPPTGGS